MVSNAMMTDVLALARAYVESGWCRIRRAVDAAFCDIEPCAPGAVAWCALGALEAAINELVPTGRERCRLRALHLLASCIRDNSEYGRCPELRVGVWNDKANRRRVLRLFERAAARLAK